jgi:N-acetylglucosamine transport system substrate-binding protein
MKILKKILMLSMAIVLVVIPLSACSDSSRNANTLKISFAECGYGKEWLEETIKAFKETHEGVEVELEGDPGMTEKISTRLDTSSELPSIFMGLQTNWQMNAYLGKIENLDDLYASIVDNNKTFAEKLQPNYLNYGKVDGHYYGVGWSDGVTGIVYNAAMFEQYGWTVPETVDDLYSLCTKIKQDTNNTVAPFSWGGQVAAYWNFPVYAWWAQYEGMNNMKEFLKYENPEVFSQQGRLNALEVFENLIGDSTNSVKDAMSKNHIMSQMEFINGKAAMIPNGAWLETEMNNNLPDGFRMKMMRTPYIDNEHKVNVNYTSAGDFMIIPSDISTEEKELAKEFIKFMATDEMLKLFTEKTSTSRPFIYDKSGITLSEFGQSVMDIYESSENLYMYSNSLLYYSVKVQPWPLTGSPYARVLDEGASSVFNSELNYIRTNWQKINEDIA